MSVARDLLDRLAEIGAKVETTDSHRLIVRAGPQPVPGELMQLLRDAKGEVLATLAPPWWRSQFVIRTIARERGGARSRAEAERLTWGELQCRWHRLHREPVPEWQCAGCGEPIGGRTALPLGDGGRVHLDTAGLGCLLAYGRRWRGAATRALDAMGLRPSAEDEFQ
jgi:hypothetical protein